LSGNTCIDNTPTGSIAFAQQYTRNLSGNTLLVNHTSAQQIEFFSDIACSQSSGVQSINSSYEIILTDSDGVKTIYARFINGTQRSGCLSSSIILDRQEPGTFVVALNTPNTTSTSAAPVVTIGSVSDFGLSGIYSLEYGIGTSTTTANHVSFFIIPTNSTSFTASVANGFLPMGTVFNSTTQYYTLIRATDNAGNTKIISSEAWTYEEPNLLAASFVLYGGRSATSGSLFMWRTDGTSAGTLQVGSQQIVSSWRGIKYKDRIWFTGFDSADNHELWVTDGTSAGTQKFMSIYPGASNGLDNSNTKFTVCNNLLFFSANDSAASVELWRTDGTTAGTFRVVDAYPGVQPGISNINNFMWCVGGDKLLFGARNASETGFWMVTDGTTLGTRRFHTLFSGVPTDIRGGSNSTAVIGNKVYFHNLTNSQNVGFGHLSIADFDTYTVTYYRMMGQTGTVTVAGTVQDMVAIDGKIYFQGAQGAQSTPGSEPWVSDGTAAGTFQLAEICSGTCSSIPSAWFRHGPNQILFRAYNGSSQDVYITNGTTAGTSILKKINPSGDSSAFINYAKFNGKTYFDANDGTFGRELWVTDGTTAGTVIVKDINPGTAASLPRAIREVNGRLVFVATHASFGAEIWSSDGTGVGTTQVRDASPGTTGSVFIFAENGAFLGL
jgi:ELWxxDGT repeat protein